MPAFTRYIGIDYSSAQAPTASLKGLSLYGRDDAAPIEVPLPPTSETCPPQKTCIALSDASFLKFSDGGRYWIRTSDPCDVNEGPQT